MDYRAQRAETDEERAKEKAFTGIGLTSRKNLCLHPEVRSVLRASPRVVALMKHVLAGLQGAEGNSGRRPM